jgi:pseudaminic acid biosynthesis-associated methylase
VSSQLERWQGEFGREYTDRNEVDWRTRVETLRRIVPTETQSVLEVGCNRGHNLLALREVLGPDANLIGSEPAEYPRQQAHDQGLLAYDRSVYDLPEHRIEHQFDLVMTSGVLIHIPPERLDEALTSIHSVAARHILAIEYYAAEDTAVEYRGHQDMLWKRDYGYHYLRLFPSLTCVSMGDLTEADGFAGARYWLLAK